MLFSIFYGMFQEQYNLTEAYSVECSLYIQGIAHGVEPGLFCKSCSPAPCSTSVTVFSDYSGPDAIICTFQRRKENNSVVVFAVLKINECLHGGDSYGEFGLVYTNMNPSLYIDCSHGLHFLL